MPISSAEISDATLTAIDERAREIGREVFELLPVQRPSVLQRRWWDERIMSLAMSDERLKVELFRFVDVLPMLRTSEAVTGHLHEYLSEVKGGLPGSFRVALGMARRTPLVRGAVARAAKLAAMDFARKFIAGTNVNEVLDAARRERELGRGFTLDILGEAVTSDREADGYFRAYCDLLENVSPTVNSWDEVPQIDRGVLGPLPRMNLSVKLSALDSQFDAIDFAGTTQRVAGRLRELLRVASRQHAFINIDMEQYEKKDITLHIFKTVLMEDEFRDLGDVGIVIQCYLRDSEEDLIALRDWAAARGKPVWVRLVKGAYWDYETIHARYHEWPVPVFQQKWQSDATFEKLVRFTIANYQHLRPAIGSHNVRSIAYALAAAEYLDFPDGGLEVQMLYGMADAQKKVLVDRGDRLRVYMPYGELIPGMAYLVRRLLENTSNDSFLRMSVEEQIETDELLKNPVEVGRAHVTTSGQVVRSGEVARPPSEQVRHYEPPTTDRTAPRSTKGKQMATDIAHVSSQFHNEPPIDFSKEDNRRAMAEAIAAVRQRLQSVYPLHIDGEPVDTEEQMESLDPSNKGSVVGVMATADRSHVARAVAAAKAALPKWAATPVAQRADFLRRAAKKLRERHFELAAWEVFECGKPWREASGDICEAIDFCEYYARGAVAMEENGNDVAGEENRFVYIPRGVAAVIAPWNFPLAILTGMTAAALVTGNPVIMKPAEQSPVIAAKLMEIFADLDLPRGVLQYLPGRGEVAGAALVEHPDVALIAFTGSRAVGLSIHRTAAGVSGGEAKMVKKVIAEMGGKNAIIVDADADLDEAVLGVVKSAFGYSGQKCSACSRAIVLDEVYDQFLDRLIESARSLKVGPAEDPATTLGPVIDADALANIQQYINIGRSEGREVLAADVGELSGQGYFVGPHIFADVLPGARIEQEEIFGPVLAVVRAADIDEALAIANDTDYALTGGIYSRSPANIDRATEEFQVGNLYINRNITGALVSRQPFGGFRMSGIGSKAGGPDYLYQFVLPRTITENTMRRGFAPPEE